MDVHFRLTSRNTVLLTAAICFVLSFAVHMACGTFSPKVPGIFPDEYRFLYDAQLSADGLVAGCSGIQGKILYPLFLSLSFIFSSTPEDLFFAINITNSLFAAMTVIPAAWLAHKLLGDKNAFFAVAFILLAGFLPDSFYSLGIMAEPLALPVMLTWFCLALKTYEETSHNKVRYFIILGLWSVVAYSCKETAVALVIAYCLMYIRDLVSTDAAERKYKLLLLLAFLAALIVPLIAEQLYLFGTVISQSYPAQASQAFWMLASPTPKLIFDLLIITVNTMAAVLFVPFLTRPWKGSWKSDSWRNLGRLCLTVFFVTIIIVIYTVTLQEDPDIPRLILRYFTPVLFVLTMLSTRQLLDAHDVPLPVKQGKVGIVAALVPCILIAVALGYFQFDYEATELLWLPTLISQSLPLGETSPNAYIIPIAIVRIIACCGVFLFYFALTHKKEAVKTISYSYVVLLAVAWIVSSVIMCTCMWTAHSADEQAIENGHEAAQVVEDTLDEGKPAIIIWELQGAYNRYSSFSPELRYATFELLFDHKWDDVNIFYAAPDRHSIEDGGTPSAEKLISSQIAEELNDSPETEILYIKEPQGKADPNNIDGISEAREIKTIGNLIVYSAKLNVTSEVTSESTN